jgi:hypothetical protein
MAPLGKEVTSEPVAFLASRLGFTYRFNSEAGIGEKRRDAIDIIDLVLFEEEFDAFCQASDDRWSFVCLEHFGQIETVSLSFNHSLNDFCNHLFQLKAKRHLSRRW